MPMPRLTITPNCPEQHFRGALRCAWKCGRVHHFRRQQRAAQTKTTGILRGTAGFGFWNYPFSMRGDILMLPEAIWFFYASPPSNMALVPGIPGWGWKAQVVHSMRAEAVASTLPMALTATWARLTGDSRPAGRWMQRLSWRARGAAARRNE